MDLHVKVLAAFYLIFGVLGILGSLMVLLIFGGAAGIISMAAPNDPDALLAVPIVGSALRCSSPWWVDYNHAPPGQPKFPGVLEAEGVAGEATGTTWMFAGARGYTTTRECLYR